MYHIHTDSIAKSRRAITACNFLFSFMLTVSAASAQTVISGAQSGTLGPGTYIVDGDILVEAGNSLSIQPGTIFLHNGNHQWLISGEFSAAGTEQDSIFFIRQNPVDDNRWGGLHFISGAPEASLNYCHIDHCLIGFSTNFFASVNVYGGIGLSLKHSRITGADTFFYGGAVYANNASVLIDSCLITSATLGNNPRGLSVYLVDCDNAQLLHSEFGYNLCTSGGT